jgi:hypothetical protein
MVIAVDRVALVTPDANCSTHLPRVGRLGRVEDPVVVENGIDRGLTDGVSSGSSWELARYTGPRPRARLSRTCS